MFIDTEIKFNGVIFVGEIKKENNEKGGKKTMQVGPYSIVNPKILLGGKYYLNIDNKKQ